MINTQLELSLLKEWDIVSLSLFSLLRDNFVRNFTIMMQETLLTFNRVAYILGSAESRSSDSAVLAWFILLLMIMIWKSEKQQAVQDSRLGEHKADISPCRMMHYSSREITLTQSQNLLHIIRPCFNLLYHTLITHSVMQQTTKCVKVVWLRYRPISGNSLLRPS